MAKASTLLPATLAAAMLAVPAAHARWPAGRPHSSEADWFRALKHNGVSCCAESDGHRLSPEYLHVTRDGKYQFKATREAFGLAGDNQWHDIPPDKIIRGKELAKFGGNPTGFVVIFTAIHWGLDAKHPHFQVYCVVPAGGY